MQRLEDYYTIALYYIIDENKKIKFLDGAVMNLQHLIVDIKLRQKCVKLRITVEGKSFLVTLPVKRSKQGKVLVDASQLSSLDCILFRMV